MTTGGCSDPEQITYRLKLFTSRVLLKAKENSYHLSLQTKLRCIHLTTHQQCKTQLLIDGFYPTVAAIPLKQNGEKIQMLRETHYSTISPPHQVRAMIFRLLRHSKSLQIQFFRFPNYKIHMPEQQYWK